MKHRRQTTQSLSDRRAHLNYLAKVRADRRAGYYNSQSGLVSVRDGILIFAAMIAAVAGIAAGVVGIFG